MFCGQCGNEVEDQYRFCTSCGHSMELPATDVSVAAAAHESTTAWNAPTEVGLGVAEPAEAELAVADESELDSDPDPVESATGPEANGQEPVQQAPPAQPFAPPAPPVQQRPMQDYGPPVQGYGPPQHVYVQSTSTNGFAIAALVLGIIWLYWIGSILALVFGYMAKSQIEQSQGRQSGRGMAIAGIVLGWIGVGVLVLLFILGVGIAGSA
jgi:hypothetical protein